MDVQFPNIIELPDDIIKETLFKADYKSTIKLCNTNKRNRGLCNDTFWFEKAKKDFGITEKQWLNAPLKLIPSDRYLFYASNTVNGVIEGSEKFKSYLECMKRAAWNG